MEIKPSVSIIVPVYNVEQYLQRCLDSLVNQTYYNIEIILINDGSTDNSLKILKHYADKDPRVVLVNKENEGISTTRNLGVETATGEYLTFVDSDDWLELDTIEKMYDKAIQEQCQLVMCSYTRSYQNKELRKAIDLKSDYLFNEQETKEMVLRKIIGPINEELAHPENLDSLVTVWGKLYKTSVIKDHNIKFLDTTLIGTEDLLFNVEVFLYLKNSFFINLPLYHYWKGNETSFTSSHNRNLNEKWKKRDEVITNLLMKIDEGHDFEEALNNRVCLSMIGLGLNEISQANQISSIQKIKNINNILAEDRMKRAYKQLELSYFPLHWKVFYLFNKYRLGGLSYLTLKGMEVIRRYI